MFTALKNIITLNNKAWLSAVYVLMTENTNQIKQLQLYVRLFITQTKQLDRPYTVLKSFLVWWLLFFNVIDKL